MIGELLDLATKLFDLQQLTALVELLNGYFEEETELDSVLQGLVGE